MSEMERAVERLYVAFRAYPLKPLIESCPHCHMENAEAALHVRPLRETDWRDLDDVFPSFLLTFGDVDDFKHFLPRIFELCLFDAESFEWPPWDPDDILEKLQYAKWTSWPREETEAVRGFVAAWAAWLEARVARDPEESWRREELRAARLRVGFDETPPE